MEISKKLVSLGDQLESISQPHTRITEAKFLITNFNEFMRGSNHKDKLESEQSEAKLTEYVDLLTKMQLVLAELDETKFQSAAMNIRSAHANLQNLLIEKFLVAVNENDLTSMSKYAKLLSKFDCYNQKCVSVYIEKVLNTFSSESENLFDDILNQIQNLENEMQLIFEDSEHVFATFLNRLFLEVVQLHIDKSLEISSGNKDYVAMTKQQLELLSMFEGNSQRFCDRLSKISTIANKNSLNSLKTKLFGTYLSAYIMNEKQIMAKFCEELNADFYAKHSHSKKTPQQLKIFGRKPFSETFDYPKLVYQDELIRVVKEIKSCIARAEKLLYTTGDKNDFGNAIIDILFRAVFDENLIYVLSLVSEGTPVNPSDLRDLKTEPFLTYFSIVSRAYSIITEVNNLYMNCVVYQPSSQGGLVTNQNHCDELRVKKYQEVEKMINLGIDRTLNFYSAWIKKIYNSQVCLIAHSKVRLLVVLL